MTTTIGTTPGIKWTTTTLAPAVSQECIHGDETFPDGALIKTEKACEHCYCMKGDIVCVVQECGTPMENEGKNCTSLPPRDGQCCPDTYICEGDNEITTDVVMTTIAPPRRTEEGYRSETDEQVTEPEGSGGYEDKSEQPSYPITTDVTRDEAEVDYTTETSKITTPEYESGEVHHTIPPEYLPESTSTSKPIGHKDSEVSSTTETGESDVQTPSEHVEPTYHTEHEEYSTPTIKDKESEPSTTESVFRVEITIPSVTTDSDHTIDKDLLQTTDLESPNVTTTPEKEHDVTPESTDLSDKESTQGENVTEKQEKLPEIDDHTKISTTEKTEDEEPTSIPKTDEPIIESSTNEPVRQETVQSTIIHDVTESTSQVHLHAASETTTKLFIGEHTETSLPDATSEDVNIITSTEIDLKDKYSTMPPKEPIEETTSEIQYEGDHTTTPDKQPSVTQSIHTVSHEEDAQKPTESEEKFSQATTEINVSEGLITEGSSEKSPDKETDIPLISTTIKETDESITLTTEKHEEPFSSETTIRPFEFTAQTHTDDTQELEVTTRADIEKPRETTTKYDEMTETTSGSKREGETDTTKTPEEGKPHVADEAIMTTPDLLHETYSESTIEPDKGLNTIPLEPYDEDHTMTVEPEDTKQTKKPEDDLSTPSTNIPDDLSTKQETDYKTPVPHTTEKSDLYTGETESPVTIQGEFSVGISSSTPKDETVEVYTPTETIMSIEHTSTEHTPKDVTSEEVPVKETTVLFDSETSSDGIIISTTDKPKVNIAENEVGEDTVPPISSPGVIPGEGSCLVDGVTYNNNSIVPSSNKCQSACKCMSSIIKCDLIQCSPPPENMMNCQSVYDSTDSCCPTYICDAIKETIPPQPHSQMAVTEPAVVESECGEDCHKTDSKQPDDKCNGGQCEVVEEPIVPQKQPELCTTESCAVPSQVTPEEPTKKSPTEHTPISPDVQKPSVIECTEQNGCKPEQSTDLNLPCAGEACRRQDSSQPESPTKDCKDGECKAEDSTTPDSSIVTEKEKECVGDVECKKPAMEDDDKCIGDKCDLPDQVPKDDDNISTEKIHEHGVSLNTENTLSEETTSTPEGTTHKLIDESQTTSKAEEQPYTVKDSEEHKDFTATADYTVISESTTQPESQTEEHIMVSGVTDSEVKPDIVTVSPDVVTITPQSQSTLIMSMETKATETSDVNETTENPRLPEGAGITQSLPTETEKSPEEVVTSPTVSPVLSEVTEPTNKPVDNVTPTEDSDKVHATESLPHETESSIAEGTVTEGAETEHAVTQSAFTDSAATGGIVTEGVVSEGAVPEGSVTDGPVTESVLKEDAVTKGSSTEGVINEGAVTEGVVSEEAVTEGADGAAVTDGSATAGAATEGAATERVVTEGAATERAVTEGAVSEGAATEGSATEGAATEGAATEGAATEGAATEGAVSEGAVTEGAISEGAVSDDIATESTATEGAALEGAVTEGVVNEDAVTEGAVSEGGAATESTVTEGAASEGAVSEGIATESAAIEGAASESAVTEGILTEVSVTKGDATEVAVTKGSVTESSVGEGAVTEQNVKEGAVSETYGTEGSITEGSVTVSHVTKDVTTEGTLPEDSVTKNAVTEGAVTENAVTVETITEASASEGAVTEGVATESAATKGTSEGVAIETVVTEGDLTKYTEIEEFATESSISDGTVSGGISTEDIASEGAATERTPTEGISIEDHVTEADLTEGAATEGIPTEGISIEGHVTEADLTEGVVTQGIVHEDKSHTESEKEYSETTESITTTSSLLSGEVSQTETAKDYTSTEGQPQEDHLTSTESPLTSASSVEDETSEKHKQDHDKDTTSHSSEPVDHTERIDVTVTEEKVEGTDVTSEYPSLVKETTSTKPDLIDREHMTTQKDLEHETPILPTTEDIVTPDERTKEPTEVTGPTTKISFTEETTVYVHEGELEATTPKTSQESPSDKETEIPVSVSEGTTESSVQMTETTSDAFIPLKESSSVSTELPVSEYHTSTTTKEYGEAHSTEKSDVHLPTSLPDTTGPQDVTFKESEVPTHHTQPSIISTETPDNQEKTTAEAVHVTELPAATSSITEDHTVKDMGTTYDDSAKETTVESESHVQTITEQEAVEETTKHSTELEHTVTPLEVTTIVSEQTVAPVEPSISPPSDSESVTEDTTKHATETEKYDEDMIHHPTLPHEEPTPPTQISATTQVPTLEQETVKIDDGHKEISTSKPVEISTSDYTSQSESDITTERVDISPESHSEPPKPHEPDEEHTQITDKPEVPALPTSPEHTEIPKITATPDEEPFKHTTTGDKLDTDVSSESPSPADVTTSEHIEPVESVPSSTEKQKPISTDKPSSEEIPSAEDDTEAPDQFPPSGTSGYGQEPEYEDSDQAFGPGTCRYGGKVYVSAQQIPRDDPCDFCFCFRSDIICLQQSCPPPIHGCHEEPIQGFCCPRYECPVSMATSVNMTTTTTTTTTTLPPHFLPHAYHGAAQRKGCQIKGHSYEVGEVVRASSGPCLHCT